MPVIPEIAVRTFRDADAPAVSTIITRALREVNSIDYAPEEIDFLCPLFTPEKCIELSRDRQMLVAEMGIAPSQGVAGQALVVGVAALREDTVRNVFVLPDFHGRGIGRVLMASIEQLARQGNINLLWVPASTTAVDFYRKLGYQEQYRRKPGLAGTQVIMSKRIT